MSGTDLGRRPVRRALISVYDKTGLEELVRGLHDAGVELVSTGGSARLIGDLGLPVTPVEELTGFPECLEGRVKTLHPRVHAGILADTRKDDHLRQLAELEVAPFELVVVNLYPFTATVASGAGADECVEQIDIGGPSMVRAAAKNHPSVAVVVDPTRYADVLAAVQAGGFTLDERTVLAAQAFAHTAAYDVAVASWMAARHVPVPEGEQGGFPGFIGQTWTKAEDLRYGENPHQHAALYRGEGSGVASAELLHGKAMSFNNYVDTDAAVRAAHDHGRLPAVAVVKHANPCGIAVGRPGDDIAEVHRRAHECDPLSAFGGVIATNQTVTRAMAETVKDIFTEVVAAPDFEPEALEILRQKKNIRLLRLPADVRADATLEVRPISGGLLVQETDRIDAVVEPGEDDRPTAGHGDAPLHWTLVAGPSADDQTLVDLDFAWKAVRAVKSNAILLAKDAASVGIGMGQVNRVDSCRLAVERAGSERAQGAVAASDAFFPFADGPQILLDAGVRAIVAPGGSMRDDETIAACERAGVTLYFTGTRHFAH
ncbi:bifunctional phosphoribosylaminoimidazolecarboxamide formyltransferase/IMP cyclohydrolase [Arsenicicoccus dermatophilus]|uniref:bifunctional phosphoribosylaminoimidazolecarboxamide formyltransferase/IMP cyclohydrolase n=1 Tax=Arsenicicoccus dermatophilus TaxID=1076331 RepID=UPI001F4C7B85|nr:bifunctional phosphoribosylaminoimidazolecarboxamide formyltransferase/IMP cyclohydrolase [Arsenicicoccus dermatophilus]MCH8612236.1 bifunctional phosphoribosylaminoimidazolecarboxamide formyltransferase/IMP cyclohydrolase [Arsenicicoccus dermatophilus]